MITLDVSERSGGTGASAAACAPCCCQAFTLKPGEMNVLMLNYAPWSFGLAGRGLIAGTEWSVEHNAEGCPSGLIDGFGPPDNSNIVLATAVNTPVAVNLAATATPPGNTFSFSVVPLSGPSRGTVSISGSTLTYTPNAGWTGFDYFSYVTTDAQGRSVIRHIRIDVGGPYGPSEWWRLSMRPVLLAERARVDRNMHTVSMPIWMPWSCRPCDRFRITIRQPYEECDGNFLWHIECLDVSCTGCG